MKHRRIRILCCRFFVLQEICSGLRLSNRRMVCKWILDAHLLSFAVLACFPNSLCAGSCLSVSRPETRQATTLNGRPMHEESLTREKFNLILKNRGPSERRLRLFRLRGGDEEGNQNVVNESEKSGSAPTQPRGWGLTAEQSALYNTSLEEANSVEYEVMAFLQVCPTKPSYPSSCY